MINFWKNSDVIYRTVLFTLVGALIMVSYAVMYELFRWLSDVGKYEFTGAFVVFVYYAIGGAIGGAIAGAAGVAPILGILYSIFFGQYFKYTGSAFEFSQYILFFLLIMSLVAILRGFVGFFKRIVGVDLSENTFIAVTIMMFVCVCSFVLLHGVFLPVLWDNFIFNIAH